MSITFQPTILIDSREKKPLQFHRFPAERGTLSFGDYSVVTLEREFAIERKSIDDLVKSIVTDRDRFERQLQKLNSVSFRRLVVIGDMDAIHRHEYRSKVSPKAVLSSLACFEIRYNVPLVVFPDPESAAQAIEDWAFWIGREVLLSAKRLQCATSKAPEKVPI